MENLILPSLGKAGSEPMLEPGSNFTLDMSPASLEALDPTHEDEGYLTTANDDENCPSSHLASSIPLTQNEIDGFRPVCFLQAELSELSSFTRTLLFGLCPSVGCISQRASFSLCTYCATPPPQIMRFSILSLGIYLYVEVDRWI